MTKHTPGPWKVSKLDGRTINGKAYRNRAGNLVTPAIASIKERTGETEANAAFIVQACNCHDELVAALKMLIRFIPDGWPMPLGYSQVVAQAETALAKAESINLADDGKGREADHER